MADTNVIHNIDNVRIYPNELMSRFPVNRCLEKLCENDALLREKFSKIKGTETVREYDVNTKYSTGDVVWFRDSNNKLYLFMRIIKPEDSHSDDIQQAIDNTGEYVNGSPDYEQYGWKNLNTELNLDKYNLEGMLAKQVTKYMFSHQNDDDMHPLGVMKADKDFIDEKIMLKDMTNVDSSRSNGFFPFQTYKMTEDKAIYQGYYRIWDCGLIEFDITYRLGYVEYDSESGMNVLTCNDMEFSFIENSDNQKYFNSTSDAQIFNVENTAEDNFSEIEDTIQKNRNNYVNVYFADIQFPDMYFVQNGLKRRIIMQNRDYMIYSSDVMSQDRNMKNGAINIGANGLTYGNRTQNGFTAIYVTYPDSQHFSTTDIQKNYNVQNGGLVSNSFTCHIIGRWTYL